MAGIAFEKTQIKSRSFQFLLVISATPCYFLKEDTFKLNFIVFLKYSAGYTLPRRNSLMFLACNKYEWAFSFSIYLAIFTIKNIKVGNSASNQDEVTDIIFTICS